MGDRFMTIVSLGNSIPTEGGDECLIILLLDILNNISFSKSTNKGAYE